MCLVCVVAACCHLPVWGPQLSHPSLAPAAPFRRTKADGEAEVALRWRRHVILRPSIIFGPPPPNPIRRGQFLQFVDGCLAAQVGGTVQYTTGQYRAARCVLCLQHSAGELLVGKRAPYTGTTSTAQPAIERPPPCLLTCHPGTPLPAPCPQAEALYFLHRRVAHPHLRQRPGGRLRRRGGRVRRAAGGAAARPRVQRRRPRLHQPARHGAGCGGGGWGRVGVGGGGRGWWGGAGSPVGGVEMGTSPGALPARPGDMPDLLSWPRTASHLTRPASSLPPPHPNPTPNPQHTRANTCLAPLPSGARPRPCPGPARLRRRRGPHLRHPRRHFHGHISGGGGTGGAHDALHRSAAPDLRGQRRRLPAGARGCGLRGRSPSGGVPAPGLVAPPAVPRILPAAPWGGCLVPDAGPGRCLTLAVPVCNYNTVQSQHPKDGWSLRKARRGACVFNGPNSNRRIGGGGAGVMWGGSQQQGRVVGKQCVCLVARRGVGSRGRCNGVPGDRSLSAAPTTSQLGSGWLLWVGWGWRVGVRVGPSVKKRLSGCRPQ